MIKVPVVTKERWETQGLTVLKDQPVSKVRQGIQVQTVSMDRKALKVMMGHKGPQER